MDETNTIFLKMNCFTTFRKQKFTHFWLYRSADKYLARPGNNKLMFLSEWLEFPSAPCLAGAVLEDHWAQTALRLREIAGLYRGADKFLARPGSMQAWKDFRPRARFQQHRDASCQICFPLQGKAPKEIHVDLTPTSDYG